MAAGKECPGETQIAEASKTVRNRAILDRYLKRPVRNRIRPGVFFHQRIRLYTEHGAMAGGVEVRGFFYWSLLDNFEWPFGYTKKFGLLAVDFADERLPRSMKPLAEVYAKICRGNRLPM